MNRRREWIIATSGGFVFLFALGAGWLTAGTVSFLVPREIAVLVYVLQVVPALGLALLLRRVLSLPPVSRNNPLRPLVWTLLLAPLLTAPALLIVYREANVWFPVALAAVFGAQLAPFAWLMQTRLYLLLALLVSLGPAVLALFVGTGTFHLTGILVGAILVAGAVAAYARAGRAASRAQD